MRQLFDHEWVGKVLYTPYWDEVLEITNYKCLGRVAVIWQVGPKFYLDFEDGSKIRYANNLVTEEELALTAVRPRNRREMLK